jgi:hypothetical protein
VSKHLKEKVLQLERRQWNNVENVMIAGKHSGETQSNPYLSGEYWKFTAAFSFMTRHGFQRPSIRFSEARGRDNGRCLWNLVGWRIMTPIHRWQSPSKITKSGMARLSIFVSTPKEWLPHRKLRRRYWGVQWRDIGSIPNHVQMLKQHIGLHILSTNVVHLMIPLDTAKQSRSYSVYLH